MSEQFIFFLRKKPLFLVAFFLSFAFIYSYLLALYFLEWTQLQNDIFVTMLFIGLILLLIFAVNYFRLKPIMHFEREEEKMDLYKQQIIHEFNLDRESNIFHKINFIQSFLQKNFAQKGLLSVKVLMLVNNTLKLYIENLEIKHQLETLKRISNQSPDEDQDLQVKIEKNETQNRTLLEYLDRYSRELMSKTKNDHKVETMQQELEHAMQMLKYIKPRN